MGVCIDSEEEGIEVIFLHVPLENRLSTNTSPSVLVEAAVVASLDLVVRRQFSDIPEFEVLSSGGDSIESLDNEAMVARQ
jgi:hypothetical protein